MCIANPYRILQVGSLVCLQGLQACRSEHLEWGRTYNQEEEHHRSFMVFQVETRTEGCWRPGRI